MFVNQLKTIPTIENGYRRNFALSAQPTDAIEHSYISWVHLISIACASNISHIIQDFNTTNHDANEIGVDIICPQLRGIVIYGIRGGAVTSSVMRFVEHRAFNSWIPLGRLSPISTPFSGSIPRNVQAANHIQFIRLSGPYILSKQK